MPEPPPFQEAARCDVCKCSFNTFKRRHHCRCCGRTLCNEHSSYQMPLPQFDIHSSVRVCCDCFNNSNRNGRETSQITSDKMDSILNSTSTLSMDEDVNTKDKCTVNNIFDAPECKCGMPLCICEAPIPDPPPTQTRVGITAPSNPRPKKVPISQQTAESVIRNRGSSSSGRTSLFFNVGQGINNALNDSCTNYEVTGEGLRAAIKNHDILAVKKLLSAGVDANYCDKLGFSLLHLAALFNETEIVFILLDHGASLDCKNAQGETPLECAPTMLQYKIKKKMEECG